MMELEDKIIKNNPGGGIMFDKNQYPRNEIGKKIIQVLVEQSETELKNFLQFV